MLKAAKIKSNTADLFEQEGKKQKSKKNSHPLWMLKVGGQPFSSSNDKKAFCKKTAQKRYDNC